MKTVYWALFLLCTSIGGLFAQAPVQPSSSEILLNLKKLQTAGSVLYIAAHPDDENTRLLAYLANELHLRTGYLSLTRGDGGQNLIGKEQGELLGLIRTQELLAARRIDGAEQFFTRANDFGFSKNPEETLTIWNKDSVLADVVWTIRKFKPDIIICRFPTTGEGGHGHHTASAILAEEAFSAAADPKRFPEQLKFTEPWQARRLFWNTFNFGGTNTTAPNQKKIDVGGYNALIGKSYGEVAANSRSMHKSQGFGTAKTRGETIEYFKQIVGDTVKTELFEGIDQTWKRVPALAKYQKNLGQIIQKFDPATPENSVPALVELYKNIQSLPNTDPNSIYWKKLKLKALEEIILASTGLFLEATAADFLGIPGNKITITTQAINRSQIGISLNKVRFGDSDTVYNAPLRTNQLVSFRHTEKIKSTAPFSSPYWLNEAHDNGMYVVKNQSLIGLPENEPAIKVTFEIVIAGLPLSIEKGLTYKSTDPVKGEVYRPFEVVPPITVTFTEKVYIAFDQKNINVRCQIKSNVAEVKGNLQLNVPQGWTVSIPNPEFQIKGKGNEFYIDAQLLNTGTTNGKITAAILLDGTTYSQGISRIEYDHIPYQFTLNDAEAQLRAIDLKKTGNSIGYIPGSGDETMTCLKQMGYNVTLLTDELLKNEDLTKYDAIVSGVRAYNTNERLQVYHEKLMNYVKSGGNLIVQYNTNNRIGPLLAKIGPYPFTISRDRVTNEKAEVRFLLPQHPVFHLPNEISSSDFDHWVQERGIYFATELDPAYEKPLSMNDPNEKPSEGSLIVSKYGTGNFVYTGLAFFRELPAGVPGAYRLFANLLSLPKNK